MAGDGTTSLPPLQFFNNPLLPGQVMITGHGKALQSFLDSADSGQQ